MSITSNLVYNYAPSMTSCSSVYVVDGEIELWPQDNPNRRTWRPKFDLLVHNIHRTGVIDGA